MEMEIGLVFSLLFSGRMVLMSSVGKLFNAINVLSIESQENDSFLLEMY